jgi:hypothetical protein
MTDQTHSLMVCGRTHNTPPHCPGSHRDLITGDYICHGDGRWCYDPEECTYAADLAERELDEDRRGRE